jgi:hypothetical protein
LPARRALAAVYDHQTRPSNGSRSCRPSSLEQRDGPLPRYGPPTVTSLRCVRHPA